MQTDAKGRARRRTLTNCGGLATKPPPTDTPRPYSGRLSSLQAVRGEVTERAHMHARHSGRRGVQCRHMLCLLCRHSCRCCVVRSIAGDWQAPQHALSMPPPHHLKLSMQCSRKPLAHPVSLWNARMMSTASWWLDTQSMQWSPRLLLADMASTAKGGRRGWAGSCMSCVGGRLRVGQGGDQGCWLKVHRDAAGQARPYRKKRWRAAQSGHSMHLAAPC